MKVLVLVAVIASLGCADVRKPLPRDPGAEGAEAVSAPGAAEGRDEPQPATKPARDASGKRAKKEAPIGTTERGLASYYGDSLAGNKTASGERYDPGALTAAHRTLPFGTIVKVSREDGREVRVRITDRGPFVRGRIIDLSKRAAKQLGMLEAGVVEVRIEVVGKQGEGE